MKEIINDYFLKNFPSFYNFKVVGKDDYYQIFLEAGMLVNIEHLRAAIEVIKNTPINIDVSCVIDAEDEEYKLLIEMYW